MQLAHRRTSFFDRPVLGNVAPAVTTQRPTSFAFGGEHTSVVANGVTWFGCVTIHIGLNNGLFAALARTVLEPRAHAARFVGSQIGRSRQPCETKSGRHDIRSRRERAAQCKLANKAQATKLHPERSLESGTR